MMTYSVLPLFLLVLLISSLTAAYPAGLKIRITDKAQGVLIDYGMVFLNKLVDVTYPDFSLLSETVVIKGLKITRLMVNPSEVKLQFKENFGLQFKISKLGFTIVLQRDINVHIFKKFKIESTTIIAEVDGVNAEIGVRLGKNAQGRLEVETPTLNCDIKADNIHTTSSGFLGTLWDNLGPVYKYFFNNKLCLALQSKVVPATNSMLQSLAMTNDLTKINSNLPKYDVSKPDVKVDYSLSGDGIKVMSNFFDVSFRGLFFSGEATSTDPVRQGADPVFRDTNQMIYVGISEYFFNSAAMSLSKSGPFEFDLPTMTHSVKWLLKLFVAHFSEKKGPVLVEFSEAPTITIGTTGLSVKLKFLAEQGSTYVNTDCDIAMKIRINKGRLDLVDQKPKCKIETRKNSLIKKVVNKVSNKMIKGKIKGFFEEGIQIPLPEGIALTEEETNYYEGFLVVGGNLNFTPGRGKK